MDVMPSPAFWARFRKDFATSREWWRQKANIVMIHGRYVGWAPEPMVAVDIFRVENGRLVEHWDVMQAEVPAHETKSKNAMFTS